MDERRWFYVLFITVNNGECCTTLHCEEKGIEDRVKKLIHICNLDDQLVTITDWIEIPSTVTANWDVDELDETLAYNY